MGQIWLRLEEWLEYILLVLEVAQSWIFLCKATYPWLICGVGSEEICFAWISVEKKCIVAVRMGARWSSKIVG